MQDLENALGKLNEERQQRNLENQRLKKEREEADKVSYHDRNGDNIS